MRDIGGDIAAFYAAQGDNAAFFVAEMDYDSAIVDDIDKAYVPADINITAIPSAKEISHGLKPAPFICYGCYAALAGLMSGLILFPSKTAAFLAGLIGVFGAVIGLLRLAATLLPLAKTHHPIFGANTDHNRPDIWPRYSVLIPLYKESQIVPRLMENLAAIDYPQDRLEIFMICEADDGATLRAVRRHIRAPFKLISVPPSLPRTKPKALNYALQYANGELVTIYDAEDNPHPQQLKTAASTFFTSPNLGALQAPLDYYNCKTNWLTRQFSLEYGFLFRVWLPFLTRLGLPFPLGGTSNHIRRDVLDSLGGWDAYNVTEDADLSFRIAASGQDIGYIPYPTREEAVEDWKAWQYQRARWMKGFLQTWLVHMSRPLSPLGWRGILRFITLQITIGSALLAGLVHVPFMLYLIGLMALRTAGYDFQPPAIWVWTGLGLCYASGIISGVLAAIRLKKNHLIPHSLLMPLYWWLLFPATLQAISEFLISPFHWNKTEHGLTAISDSQSVEAVPPHVA